MPYHHYSFAFTSNSQGGSSRLFWFLIGGVAATVYLKVRERRNIWGRGGKEKRALPECPGCPSEGARAREQLRPLQVDTETSEAALDVADATLDAAMRIIDGLKQTLGERRAEAGQARIQTGQQASSAGPSRRSPSPSLAASFHHVEGSG